MSTNQSQKIQVTITVSREFHRILERMAKSFDQTVEKYALALIICGLDCDLQTSAGSMLGFKNEIQYQDQLRALAAGGTA